MVICQGGGRGATMAQGDEKSPSRHFCRMALSQVMLFLLSRRYQCRRHVGEYRKVKPCVKNGEYKNQSMAESQTSHLWHNCAPFYLQRYNLSLTCGAILRHIAACDITKSNMWYHKKPPVTTFFITCSNAMRQKCSLGREARHSSFRNVIFTKHGRPKQTKDLCVFQSK